MQRRWDERELSETVERVRKRVLRIFEEGVSEGLRLRRAETVHERVGEEIREVRTRPVRNRDMVSQEFQGR